MVNKLIKYATQLKFNDLEERLIKIAHTLEDGKAPLILPLVGEFSAGKTTLINALSDSKALQTASKPTTATIYSLHFGASSNHAVIHNQDGTVAETDNIAELDNEKLTDAVVIEVYDTSTKVPASIMLVDTPGLSSHDIKHRQNLVDFLPQADGVLLTVDVNQPITKSLTEFARMIEMSKRPLYMILTMCDTKSKQDIAEQKQYILNNTELHLAGVACVSAQEGDLSELDALLNDIQKDKTNILNHVNESRMKEIAKEMIARISTLLRTEESDDVLDDEIRRQQMELNKLKRGIEDMTKDIEADIETEGRTISRQFEDEIFSRLETIVSGSSTDFDQEALSAINNTSSLMLSDFKTQVSRVFNKHASKCADVSSVDLSNYAIEGLSYNINLNEAGHEYDSAIGTTLKVAAVAAAVAVTAGAAAPAAGGAAAGGAATGGAAAAGGTTAAATATTAETIALVTSGADTVTDVASIISNKRNMDRLNKMVKYGDAMSNKLEKANNYDEKVGRQVGAKKGIISSMVGFVTEKTMGRPQRRRVISQYIESTLAPAFKSEISRISREIIKSASEAIVNDSQASMDTMTAALKELKDSRASHQAEYEEKIKTLRTIKKELQTI